MATNRLTLPSDSSTLLIEKRVLGDGLFLSLNDKRTNLTIKQCLSDEDVQQIKTMIGEYERGRNGKEKI